MSSQLQPQDELHRARPRSATHIWTGATGLVSGTAAVFAAHAWSAPGYQKTLAVMLVAGAAMMAVELAVHRVHRNATTGLAASPARPANLARILQKLIGFWATVAAIATTYWVLPEYAGDYYLPFKEAFVFCLPALLLIAPLYIWYVDSRQVEPEDAYVTVYRLVTTGRVDNRESLSGHVRSWLVKGFFLPLMFVFLNGNLQELWQAPAIPTFQNYSQFYEYVYDLLFMWDVMLAAVGYILTLRLLDSHIRSAEPTVLGWVVCLACYPPFWGLVGSNYLPYERDGEYWGGLFSSLPSLYILWGSIILLLVAVYVWATVIFGIRFSNLTHRGIITNGPYRWMKHPAYVSKNLTWWMISVPFITTGGWQMAVQSSLMLLGVNGLYLLRAITEERHLARDPVYREYQAYIAEHGLWANLRRLVGAGRARASVVPSAD